MIYRYIIFVLLSKANVANERAEQYAPDTGEGETFGGVLLSVDGNEPATYTCCNTSATEEMKTGILNSMGNVPFYRLYQVLADGTIQRRDGNTWTTIAASGDFYEVAKADAGLVAIESEE